MEKLFYAVANEYGFGVYYYREDVFKDLYLFYSYDVLGLPDYHEAKVHAVNRYMELSGDMIDVDSVVDMMDIDNFYVQEYIDESSEFEDELMDGYPYRMII